MVDASSPPSTSPPPCYHDVEIGLPRQQGLSVADNIERQLTESTNRQKSQDTRVQNAVCPVKSDHDSSSRHPLVARPSRLASLWATNDADAALPQHSSGVFSSDSSVRESFYGSSGSLDATRVSLRGWSVAQVHVRSQSWAHPSDCSTLQDTESLNWSTLRSRVRAGVTTQGGHCGGLPGHTTTPELVDWELPQGAIRRHVKATLVRQLLKMAAILRSLSQTKFGTLFA